MAVIVSCRNRTPALAISLYGIRTASGVVRPNITSSFAKPNTNASLLSISVTAMSSPSASESVVASSRPPNPAPRMTTRVCIARAYPASAHYGAGLAAGDRGTERVACRGDRPQAPSAIGWAEPVAALLRELDRLAALALRVAALPAPADARSRRSRECRRGVKELADPRLALQMRRLTDARLALHTRGRRCRSCRGAERVGARDGEAQRAAPIRGGRAIGRYRRSPYRRAARPCCVAALPGERQRRCRYTVPRPGGSGQHGTHPRHARHRRRGRRDGHDA